MQLIRSVSNFKATPPQLHPPYPFRDLNPILTPHYSHPQTTRPQNYNALASQDPEKQFTKKEKEKKGKDLNFCCHAKLSTVVVVVVSLWVPILHLMVGGSCKWTFLPAGGRYDGIGEEADWGIMVAEIERISKRPWKVTVAPGVVEGCRRVTLATVPEPLSTQRPILRRREKRAIASTISTPPGTSRT
ncbi:unnamed protein product, partial [Vitis vinifera]